MAFEPRNLEKLEGAKSGFSLWHYTTTDDLEAVQGEGYFAAALAELKVGDVVILHASAGSDRPGFGFLMVVRNGRAGAVDIVQVVGLPLLQM